MKKRDKIYDSPEYKQIKEHLPEILKELERDKGLSQYQIPEEWNGDFERIYQKECRKEHIKRRILAGACAAVILTISAVHIGTHLEFTSVAQADDIIFQDEDLGKVYNEIRAEVKRPIFEFGNMPDNCIVEEAIYNKTYRNISIRLKIDNTYVVHVNQQKQIDDIGNGTVDEGTIDAKVKINALDMDAIIYKSVQDDSLKCKIIHDNTVLFVGGNLPKEEFKKLIEGLFYK